MVEGSEMFSLQIGASPNYNIGAPAMASGTITDNDGGPPPAELPVVTIAATDGIGTESRTARTSCSPSPGRVTSRGR